MAHRAMSVCLTLFFSAQLLIAQQEDESWLSFSRLTFTATGSYHYAPWKKYNESLLLVQDAVRYNPAYANPSGSLEQIYGDFTYRLEATYRMLSSLFITVNAGWLKTEGVIDFHNTSTSTPPTFSESYVQTMWLSSFYFGAGIAYSHLLDHDLSLSAGASIDHYRTNLDFQATYQLDGQVGVYFPPKLSYLFKANLKEPTLGVDTFLEARLKVSESLSFVSRVEYRWLTLKNLRWSGSETDIRTYASFTEINGPNAFEAQLGEAGGYFGLFIPSLNVSSYYLHRLWSRTRTPSGPWEVTQQPASLDLSGFGISLGVSYAF